MSDTNRRRFDAYDYLVSFVVLAVTVPAVTSATRGTVGVWEIVAFCLSALSLAHFANRFLKNRNGPT